jgi:3',5'-cyclic AMP phosphodiesterase CpdA
MEYITRRKALSCLGAWSGAAVIWGVAGGVPRALGLASESATRPAKGQFTFAQISDTHVGFHKEANPDVIATLRQAIGDINGLAGRPAFAVHTGDITHLSKAEEFDLAGQVLQELRVDRIHYIPGEHDALDQGLNGYLGRYGSASNNRGYYSFDDHGVHFVALVNVLDFKAGNLASLGDSQLEWLKRDLSPLTASTPIVVLAHIPLWNAYEPWGWGTADSDQAMQLLRRFGSVTVLNGHIHQVMQKVEGNITFHTALSTAYPQPKPGTADAPGPLKVAAADLGRVLGTRQITLLRGQRTLATIDTPLLDDAATHDAATHDAATHAAAGAPPR